MTRYIIAIIALLIAGTIFLYYTKPTYDASQTVQAQSAQYDVALQKAAELQTLKQTLLQRYNSFNPTDLDHVQKLLPDHVDNVALILDLDNLAARFGMPIQNVDVSTPASAATSHSGIASIGSSGQKFDSVTIRFSTRGSYENFLTLLNNLEKSLRIVDFISLHMTADTSPGARQDVPAYAYDIALRTYWLK